MRLYLHHLAFPLALLLGSASQPVNALLGLDLGLGGLLGLNLGIKLLQPGALVNINAFADVVSPGSERCSAGQTIGLRAQLLGVLRVCACVNLFNGGTRNPNACPDCPVNAIPICGATKCACACQADYFADAKGVCVPRVICAPPNILTPISDGIKSTCTCAAGYKSDGNGGCVLGATGRARLTRSMMKRVVPAHPHAARPGGAAHKKIVKGRSLVDQAREQLYPFGETACPLSSGGFECLDVTSSLVSCGGCVGDGMPGKNCLAIPGALNVQCAESQCHIASCFKGYRFKEGKCIKVRSVDSLSG